MSAPARMRTLADLSTHQALSAQVVHKAAIEQVFVTDWIPGPGEDWCTIAARLPLAHARFSDTAAPYHDILLVAETVRQAGLVVAEEILSVKDERQFLLRELKVELDPLVNAHKGRETCDMLVSQDPSSQVNMRPGRAIAGGTMHARLTIAGQPAGSCEVLGAWVPTAFYASLRSGNRQVTSRMDPTSSPRSANVERRTGKVSPANCVLTPLRFSGQPRAYESSLLIDTDDPTFFDHPLDHVPGLYLLAGIQQVAVAAACEELSVDHSSVVVSALRMKFSRIAEFQPDVLCTVVLGEDYLGATVACVQDGKTCCRGTVGISRV